MPSYFGSLEVFHASTWSGTRPVSVRSIPHFALKLVTEGAGVFGRAEGTVQDIGTSTLFWQRPGIEYHWGPHSAGWEIAYLHFRGSRAGELLHFGFDPLSETECIALRNGEVVAQLLLRAATELQSPSLLTQPSLYLLLEQILFAVQRDRQEAAASAQDRDRLAPLLERVAHSPGEAFDFHSEAEGLGLSYSHFRRLFREQTGAAPQEYLIRARIRAVAHGLTHTNMPVKQLAGQAGYTDVGHFGKLFLKRMGMTPGQYRTEHGLI